MTPSSKPVTICFPVSNPKIFDKSVQVVLSAYAGSRRPDYVCVIDNSDGALFEQYYLGADPTRPNNFPSIEVVSFGKNMGLPYVWNYALQRFDDWLILPGDDVVFHQDTLAELVRTAEADESAMIVYPNQITDPRDDHMSPWSFFLQRRRTIELVGMYDEGFFPLYFADNDYARRMQLAGIGSGIVGAGVTAGHWGSATMKAYEGVQVARHHETFGRCEQYYVKKWGGKPGNERFTVPFGTKIAA